MWGYCGRGGADRHMLARYPDPQSGSNERWALVPNHPAWTRPRLSRSRYGCLGSVRRCGGSAPISRPAPLWSLIRPSDSSRTTGLACRSHTTCSLEFRPSLVRPIRRGSPFLQQTCCRAVDLEVSAVDDDAPGWTGVFGQCGEDASGHAVAGPADVAVVERLVRTVDRRDIAPAQAVALDVDDPIQHPTIVHPRLAA